MYTKKLYSKEKLVVIGLLILLTLILIWTSLISGNEGINFQDTFKIF